MSGVVQDFHYALRQLRKSPGLTVASLVVAIMGLYAVMAYSVIERHREFALRIALGSTRKNIMRLVLRGSAAVAALGVVVGGLGSIAAVRLLRSTLFGVAPLDPATYLAATVLLLLTVVVSGLIPARRAEFENLRWPLESQRRNAVFVAAGGLRLLQPGHCASSARESLPGWSTLTSLPGSCRGLTLPSADASPVC